MAVLEQRNVQVGPHSIHVHVTGPAGDDGQDAAQAPLILVHGFGGSQAGWLMVQPAWARHRRVIAFDLPGHGASSTHVGAGTLSCFADVVGGLMDVLGVASAHVLGHSLGGGIALALLRACPQKLRSLSLIAPAGLGSSVNMAFVQGYVNAHTVDDIRNTMDIAVATPGLIGRQAARLLLHGLEEPGRRDALRQIAQACFPHGRQAEDFRALIRRAPIPVRLVWGQDDAVLPPPPPGDLAAEAPCIILPRTGHLPQLERATEVAQAVNEFLQHR
ncbi:alpha/beta fold hydrolase [Acetobacter sp. TBRC 12305]|uniref:Alpha/beta fold hydrolase n=1 Tax=Acetobacter garciniae TaxID=2817435 RepID=A0A939KP82_9PROT|nr:alpha/beta fold hydrolase [Acetobacter garciniae]MBO1323619.1 alpha/beta fold hydrolase [Acetobacter garciniae]MBX0343308.1 alpha/beta fold hydrolase [Acetobacter garciniae]